MGTLQTWTEVEQVQLIDLVGKKFSASMIGREMHKSRNAVMGRCHRTGLRLISVPRSKERKPYRRYDKQNRPHRRRPERHLSPIQELFYCEATDLRPDFSENMVAFHDAKQGQCRWPIGDPGSVAFRFCGSETMKDQSYCARHCRIAYRKHSPRDTSHNYARKLHIWEVRT